MSQISKVLLGIIAIIVVIFIGSIIFFRLSYDVARNATCTTQDAKITAADIQKKVETVTTEAEPYVVLKLEISELQALINDSLKTDGIQSCIKMKDNKQMTIFLYKNPYLWVQADAEITAQKPLLKVNSVHWNNVTIPGLLVATANQGLNDAYNAHFNKESSRHFDKVEMDGTTLLIYSGIDE